MKRKWLLAGGAAVVVALAALGAGAVMASEEDGEGRTFLDRVAEKLGIETGTLEQAIRDARSDQIEEALAEGDITEEQAQRLREWLEEFEFDGGHPFGFGRRWGGPHTILACVRGVGFGLLPADDGGLAEFLGMTQEELKDALAEDGATLAGVAEAQGKSRDEVKDFLLQNADERLSEAVADGDITQAQADRCLEELDQAVERLLDAEFRLGLRFERGFRWRDHLHGDGSDDGADAAPQRGHAPALSES